MFCMRLEKVTRICTFGSVVEMPAIDLTTFQDNDKELRTDRYVLFIICVCACARVFVYVRAQCICDCQCPLYVFIYLSKDCHRVMTGLDFILLSEKHAGCQLLAFDDTVLYTRGRSHHHFNL